VAIELLLECVDFALERTDQVGFRRGPPGFAGRRLATNRARWSTGLVRDDRSQCSELNRQNFALQGGDLPAKLALSLPRIAICDLSVTGWTVISHGTFLPTDVKDDHAAEDVPVCQSDSFDGR